MRQTGAHEQHHYGSAVSLFGFGMLAVVHCTSLTRTTSHRTVIIALVASRANS